MDVVPLAMFPAVVTVPTLEHEHVLGTDVSVWRIALARIHPDQHGSPAAPPSGRRRLIEVQGKPVDSGRAGSHPGERVGVLVQTKTVDPQGVNSVPGRKSPASSP